jgi:anti-anti-sigma factor
MLTIDVEKTDGVAVVRCAGRIVRGEEVRILRNAVVSENDTRAVVLDLSDVDMLDAGGLTALLSLHQWTRSRGIQLKLVNPSHFVLEVLTRTRLDRVFDISTFHDALVILSASSTGCSTASARC